MKDRMTSGFAPAPVGARPASIEEGEEDHPPSSLVTANADPLAFPSQVRPILAQTHRLPRFPVSPEAKRFCRRFFAEAPLADWSDWRWQVRNRIRDVAGLNRLFTLSELERRAVEAHCGSLPVGITPYYASLMSLTDANEPLRRTHIPVMAEYLQAEGEAMDPLAEDADTVVPGLVHRYPDRVLFLTMPFCSTYCRYCTRSRMVGAAGEYAFGTSHWERAIAYIASHPEIRDVLLSGGDPLALATEKLDWLLERLRAIRHVEFLRIGTKVPVVLPMRITRDLTRMLKRHHPLWLSIHFTHPRELTPEVTEACSRLADAGIPLGSQTVLLKGINDDVATLGQLFRGLLMRRVRPYYLYQCDPIKGSAHFRTSVEKGLEIIQGLRGHTSGYAIPTFVIDAPGGGGKIPLLPDPVVGRDGQDLLLRNYTGAVFRYPDPESTFGADKDGCGGTLPWTSA
ncbi:MAG: KamA family radical SAM protein [Gammaproteobacteria bacterium]|jgi:lysine 2,3-aminomutase